MITIRTTIANIPPIIPPIMAPTELPESSSGVGAGDTTEN